MSVHNPELKNKRSPEATPSATEGKLVNLDALVRELPDDLRTTLALLHSAGDDVAELTLGTLPFGSRMTLLGYGVISRDQAAEEEGIVLVRLTDVGRALMAACATGAAPHEVRERIEALRAARAQRAADRANSPAKIRAVAARG